MKIIISAYDRTSSGISSYTFELAKLLSRDFDVTLLSFDDIELTGIKVVKMNLSLRFRVFPLLTFLRNRGEVRNILQDFDIVHETLPPWGSPAKVLVSTKWGYLPYWRLSLVRLSGLSFPENLGAFPVTFQHYLMDGLSRRNAKYVIDVSRESPFFVPPPIELRPPKDYQCSTMRLLFVSRDLGMPRKNLRIVLEALKIVKRPVELHLVGKGRIPEPKPTFPIVNHGFLSRDEVFTLMREVDLLILPSTYEELGFVGLEAYSVGLPVITSDIPSFRAVFKISPKFNPKDPKSLANLLESLSCEELKILGKESREYVVKANEVARKRLSEIYKHVGQL